MIINLIKYVIFILIASTFNHCHIYMPDQTQINSDKQKSRSVALGKHCQYIYIRHDNVCHKKRQYL
jgi:hypothetical protein